jgi:7,8-dihydroneopterin aldolase/epimerase/oxygenase
MGKIHSEISLEGLEFFAYHGYYAEEQKTGNNFSVDIKVIVQIEPDKSDDLNGTINYEEIYLIVKKEMEQPSRLLEDVAKRILDKIFLRFENIDYAEIGVSKLNPPIPGKCRQAKVLLKRSR